MGRRKKRLNAVFIAVREHKAFSRRPIAFGDKLLSRRQ